MTRWRSDVASKRRGLYQSARLCRLANVKIGDKSGTRSDDDDRDEGRTKRRRMVIPRLYTAMEYGKFGAFDESNSFVKHGTHHESVNIPM